MLSLSVQTKPSSEAIYTELHNGEAVLLHLGTHRYYTLNPTGVKIWQLVNQTMALGEIASALQEQYEVSHEQAQESVTSLLQELVDEKLLLLVD